MRTQIPPKHPAYTYLKGNVYYFSRAIPADLKNYYSKPRVIQSLRTTNRRLAVHSSRLLSVRLEDYWHDLRLRNTEPPCAHLFTHEHLQGSSTVITLAGIAMAKAAEKVQGQGSFEAGAKGPSH